MDISVQRAVVDPTEHFLLEMTLSKVNITFAVEEIPRDHYRAYEADTFLDQSDRYNKEKITRSLCSINETRHNI